MDLNCSELDRLAEPLFWITFGKGTLPLIGPRQQPTSFMEFDRAVCAAGLKKFGRRLLPGENRPTGIYGVDVTVKKGQANIETEWVLVEEIRPGMRKRRPLLVLLNEQGARDRQASQRN